MRDPTPRPPDCNAALVLADGTVFWGRGLGAVGMAIGEVCFNTASHRLSGDPDRSVLRRSDHHFHLSPHRQRRRESGGCRSHDPGGARARPAHADHRRRRTIAPTQSLDAWLRVPRAHRDFGRRHAAADAADSRLRGAEWRGRLRSRWTARHPRSACSRPQLAGSRRDGSRQGGHLSPNLRMGRNGLGSRARLWPPAEPAPSRRRD